MRCVDGDSELWRKSHLTLLCPPLLHWLDAELSAQGHGHHVEVEKAPPVRVRVGLEMQQEKNGFLKGPTNACTSSNYFYLRKKHCKHQLCAKEEVAHFVHFCANEYSIWNHQPPPPTPKKRPQIWLSPIGWALHLHEGLLPQHPRVCHAHVDSPQVWLRGDPGEHGADLGSLAKVALKTEEKKLIIDNCCTIQASQWHCVSIPKKGYFYFCLRPDTVCTSNSITFI